MKLGPFERYIFDEVIGHSYFLDNFPLFSRSFKPSDQFLEKSPEYSVNSVEISVYWSDINSLPIVSYGRDESFLVNDELRNELRVTKYKNELNAIYRWSEALPLSTLT